MVKRRSVRQERLLKEFGANLARWRKVNGLSASALAERAFITRETLSNIENGSGSARIDSVFAVLTSLGIVDAIVKASDPYASDAARPRIDEILRSGDTL